MTINPTDDANRVAVWSGYSSYIRSDHEVVLCLTDHTHTVCGADHCNASRPLCFKVGRQRDDQESRIFIALMLRLAESRKSGE